MLQGTAIEATMWREVADKCHPLLEEGNSYSPPMIQQDAQHRTMRSEPDVRTVRLLSMTRPLQGTAIEATMWREVADKYHPLLEEGKVYFFSRGKVKPANKNFSAVRNDYTISFDNQCAPKP